MKRKILLFTLGLLGLIKLDAQVTSKFQLPQSLQNGLVAFYPFAGNTNDESGFGNTIQNYGAVLVEDQSGHPNSAYRFDGISSYMTIPYATSFEALTDQFSISYWIKNNKPVNHGGMHLLHRQDGNLAISIGGNNEFDFTRQGQAYLLQSNQILDTNWFHMVFTKNGSIHNLYINGILVQSSTANIGLNNTIGNELTIGKATAGGNGGAYRLEADLTQLMWYNRVLSDSEVTSLYNLGTGLSCLNTNNFSINPFADTTVLRDTGATLDAGANFANYTWSTGATTQTITPENSGLYKVTVTTSDGCVASDSTQLFVQQLTLKNKDTTICLGDSLELNLKSLRSSVITRYDFDDCTLSGFAGNGEGSLSVGNNGKNGCGITLVRPATAHSVKSDYGYGTYTVFAKAGSGIANQYFGALDGQLFMDCRPSGTDDVGYGIYYGNTRVLNSYSNPANAANWYSLKLRYTPDSIKFWIADNLVYEALVPFQLAVKTGSILVSTYDVSLYDEFTYEPYSEPSAVTNIQWSTGETASTIKVAPQQTTSYTVEVNENGYVWKDTVQVDVSTISASFNPFSDTLRVCSDSIVLDAGEGYTSYVWNTGDTAQLLSVSKTGNFNLSVQNEFGCKATDQVLVSITKAAILENDTTICLGASLTLHKSGNTIGSNHNNLPNHLKNGLVAYYPFNGNANDESGYSNNGSVNGAQLSTDRFGSSNSAYHFNGSSDFITCTSVPQVNNLSNFTMSAWIKLEGWNTNTNCNSGCAQFILSRDADNNSPAHFALVSGEAPGYEVLGGNIRQGTTDGTAYTSNNYAFPHTNWHLVTMTLGDGLVKLYVDGALMVTNTCSHSTGSTSAPLLIGRNAKSDYPYFVNGNVDDVMLYSRTLSLDEVLELYNLNDNQQEWSTGEIADSITVLPQSDTTYYFTVSNGISTCVDSVKVYVQDLSKYNSLTDSAYLVNGTLDLDASAGYNNYSWNNGATQRILTVNSPGLYTVQVSSNYGCNAKDSVSVFQRPEVKYIQRASPIDSITGLSTVTFIARFTKPVSSVDLTDFSAYSTNNVQSVLSAINKIDDSTYTITLNSLSGTGALRLDLKSSGTGIKDLDGIDLSGGFTNGVSYWIDRDNPETSIQSKPSSITKNTTASFLFRSNEAPVKYETSVDGVGYALLSDSTQTINGLSAGTHSISVRAIDAAGNKDAIPATYSWKIDLTAPSVSSINRQSPLDSVTNLTSLTWRVRFSEPVTGVDTSDFTLTAVSPAVGKLSAISKLSDSLYDVSATVSNNTGGSLRLDLKSSVTGIADSATNNISGGFTTGQKYTLNNVSIKCPANIMVAAAAGKCTQTVAFTGNNAVTVTGVTNPVITYVPASGTAFNVGTTTVTATVKSGTTTVGTCSFTVTVTDSQLPTVSALTASSVMLAPGDHTMKTINLTYTATDNCTTVTSVVTVTSNQPDAGTGDGDLPGDIVIVNNKQVQLRAEKTPGSAARVYTITLTVKDAAGNTVVKTAEVRVAHEILTPGTGSCYAINSTVPFTGQYWDAAGLTHTAAWTADATSIAGTDVEPLGATNGSVSGSNRFTTAGVYKMKMNLKDNKNVTTYSDLNKGLSALITIFGNTGTYSYGGGCMDIPAGSVVAKPTVSGKASFGFTVSGTSATTGRGEVELDFRSGVWEFNTTTITNYTVSGAKLTMTGTGKVTGVTTTYNYTLTAIDGNHPLGGGIDKVRLRVTTTAGAVIFDNNPGALATADPSMAVCTGLGQVYVPGGAAIGSLETPREAINLTQEKLPLSIKVSPNPTVYSFRIAIGGGTKEPVKMRLTDLFGRLVDERSELQPNSIIEIGQKLRSGVFMAEFYQGEERVVVKLVKAE